MVDVYLSVDDVEDYIGKEFTSSTSPTATEMGLYITRAETDFESEFGVYSTQTNTDEIVDGWSFGLFTKNKPINSLTAVAERSGTMYDPTWTELSSDKFRVKDSSMGKVYTASPIIGEEVYQIDYTSGYSLVDMPKHIKDIVMSLAFKHVFKGNIFKQGQTGDTETIIDVDVYKQITKGGSPYSGLQELDMVIDEQKKYFKNKLKTMLQ